LLDFYRIREGANVAIDDGKEQLTRSVLEKVKLAFASEAHQATTPSKKVKKVKSSKEEK